MELNTSWEYLEKILRVLKFDESNFFLHSIEYLLEVLVRTIF